MSYSKQKYQQLLDYCLLQQQTSIARHTLPNGEIVWVRRDDSHNSIWAYRFLRIFTTILRADALRPIPSLGGKVAIANEISALIRLSKCRIKVPKLLAMSDNALMMSNLNGSKTLMTILEQAYNNNDIQTILNYWEHGINAIIDVHKKKQHLSQCFPRNMIVCNDNSIGFIDFEDAPEKLLTVHQCQIRDWLCYLSSSVFLFDDKKKRQQATKIFIDALDKSNNIVIADIYHNTRFLSWLRHFHRRYWGRDAVRVALFMKFIQTIKIMKNK